MSNTTQGSVSTIQGSVNTTQGSVNTTQDSVNTIQGSVSTSVLNKLGNTQLYIEEMLYADFIFSSLMSKTSQLKHGISSFVLNSRIAV